MTPEESAAQAIAAATAQPAKLFEKDALYTISVTIDGTEYALTFILPQGVEPSAITSSGSKASVQLTPLQPDAATQMWKPIDAGINPTAYLLYSRISGQTNNLTGIMKMQNLQNEFSDPDNDTYHDKYNRVTVNYHSNEATEYWILEKLDNGLFRIMNFHGHTENINAPGENSPYKWNESRSLTGFKGTDGKVKLRHMPHTDAPEQQWKFTKVGFFTAS